MVCVCARAPLPTHLYVNKCERAHAQDAHLHCMAELRTKKKIADERNRK